MEQYNNFMGNDIAGGDYANSVHGEYAKRQQTFEKFMNEPDVDNTPAFSMSPMAGASEVAELRGRMETVEKAFHSLKETVDKVAKLSLNGISILDQKVSTVNGVGNSDKGKEPGLFENPMGWLSNNVGTVLLVVGGAIAVYFIYKKFFSED